MKFVRLVATVLYYLTRATSVLLVVTALYAFVLLFLSLYAGVAPDLIEIKDNGSFIIFYPFSNIPFLLGDYTKSYFLISTSTLGLYGLFLWLLSSVFKAFMQQRLFVPLSVLRLRRFYVFNLGVPILFLLFLLFTGHQMRDAVIIVFLHLMIGVFAYFMAVIFQQGLVLQEEQDLTL